MQLAASADELQAQGIKVAGVATTLKELVGLVGTESPRLLLVAVGLLGASLPDALNRLRLSILGARTIFILAPTVKGIEPGAAIRCGADGYLIAAHPDQQFVVLLADLLAGVPSMNAAGVGERFASALLTEESRQTPGSLRLGLTDRQQELLVLIVRGFTYCEIAAQLYVSERTVRYNAHEIRKRMGVSNCNEMVEFALLHNLLQGVAGFEAAVY